MEQVIDVTGVWNRKAGSNGSWKDARMNRPSWRETILTDPDEQYYSLMRQISRNQIFMLRSHLCVRMNNYYIHDNPYYKRYNSMYIYQIISLDRINIFHQKILLLVELKKFVIACLVYFHVHFS